MRITAKAKVKVLDNDGKDTGEEIEIPIEADYDFGDNINQIIENHGEDAAFHHAKSSMVVAFQSALRSWAGAGLIGDELEAKVATWSVPTGRPRAMSRMERFKKNLAALSDDEKQDVLKELGLA